MVKFVYVAKVTVVAPVNITSSMNLLLLEIKVSDTELYVALAKTPKIFWDFQATSLLWNFSSHTSTNLARDV